MNLDEVLAKDKAHGIERDERGVAIGNVPPGHPRSLRNLGGNVSTLEWPVIEGAKFNPHTREELAPGTPVHQAPPQVIMSGHGTFYRTEATEENINEGLSLGFSVVERMENDFIWDPITGERVAPEDPEDEQEV